MTVKDVRVMGGYLSKGLEEGDWASWEMSWRVHCDVKRMCYYEAQSQMRRLCRTLRMRMDNA